MWILNVKRFQLLVEKVKLENTPDGNRPSLINLSHTCFNQKQFGNMESITLMFLVTSVFRLIIIEHINSIYKKSSVKLTPSQV